MAAKVRILAVALAAISGSYLNEAVSLGAGTDAELTAYQREHLRHHAALANISQHMSVTAALHLLQGRRDASPDLVAFLHQRLGRRHAHAHSRLRSSHRELQDPAPAPGEEVQSYAKELQSAKDMLNNMIYEVQTQYEIEHKKCCDYEHTKRTLIEEAAQDISLFNAEAAQARGQILSAQSQIGIAEGRIPKLRDSLSLHNNKCSSNINTLKKEISTIAGDKAVMESLAAMAECKKDAPQADVELLQCTHPCTQENHMLFANDKVRNLVRNLKSNAVRRLMQQHLAEVQTATGTQVVSSLLQEKLDHELVSDYEAAGNSSNLPKILPSGPCHRPPPTDKRSSKCAIGGGNCLIVQERLLIIHATIIDKITELRAELNQLQKSCNAVKLSLENQVSDFSTLLVAQQSRLAAATKAQNTADEQNRLKSVEKSNMEKEFRTMTETCHRNYQSFEDQECGLKKVRGELFRMKAPEASSIFEDCQLSAWSAGVCSVSCGGGTQLLSRTIVTAPKGGVRCLPLERRQSCNNHKCPIDCKLADWQSWSGCTADCGGGVQQRARMVTVKPRHNGKPCGETTEVRGCNLQSCNADCKLAAWTPWSSCSKACGGGRQRRLRFVEEKARGTGKCPHEKSEARLEFMACNTRACPANLECQSNLDVVLLLDGSSRIGPDGWEATKLAGEQLVKSITSGGRAQVAVILFSGPESLKGYSACTNEDPTAPPPDMARDCKIQVVSQLTRNTADLVSKVKSLSWPSGSALTSVALGIAEAELSLGRKDASSVVLVVTRGKPMSLDKTTVMAHRLRQKARVMWVPVIGNEPVEMFRKWSSDPDDENIIVMRNFAQLKEQSAVDTIIATMCPAIAVKAFMPMPTHEWDFRECTGNVKDAQGGKLAVLTGAECKADGVYFNGKGQFITYESFNLGGSIAVEALVKYEAFNSWSRVFDFGNGPGDNDILLANQGTSNNLWFEVNRPGAQKKELQVGNQWQAGRWQHVFVTISGGAQKVYLNGVLVGQRLDTSDPAVTVRRQMYSGKSQYSWDAFFQGSLGYLRVWNGVALGADTAAALHKEQVRVVRAAPVNSCKRKLAYGIIRMSLRDCKAMGGRWNGNPSDGDWIDCHLDWCLDGQFAAAKVGTCKAKVGYGIIRTQTKHCIANGGAMNGSPGPDEWTDCHLDWCRDGTYAATAAGQGAGRWVNYGIIRTTLTDCRRLGGAWNGQPAEADWIDCHVDWVA